jgi:hypothetical protein
MKPKKVTVFRQDGMADEDLRLHIQKVQQAVEDNRGLFDGVERYDLWVEVVTPDWVVVENHREAKYFRANYEIDENDNVVFSNVIEVVRQYVPAETVERSKVEVVDLVIRSLWEGVV